MVFYLKIKCYLLAETLEENTTSSPNDDLTSDRDLMLKNNPATAAKPS
ncbi:hypothetical protein QWY85_09675 [Neolewinella lacunae]|nr:hypothetical protein [Neolewinella lacunae]MDN3634927.1 hypothetical protein [Neolewinella lacunae]